jgi:hypothetical protein
LSSIYVWEWFRNTDLSSCNQFCPCKEIQRRISIPKNTHSFPNIFFSFSKKICFHFRKFNNFHFRILPIKHYVITLLRGTFSVSLLIAHCSPWGLEQDKTLIPHCNSFFICFHCSFAVLLSAATVHNISAFECIYLPICKSIVHYTLLTSTCIIKGIVIELSLWNETAAAVMNVYELRCDTGDSPIYYR